MADARSPYYHAGGPEAALRAQLLDALEAALPALAEAADRVRAAEWSLANLEDRRSLERVFRVSAAVARLALGRPS